MRVSYSRVGTWEQCPYKFYLRYIAKVEGEAESDPQSPLLTGSMLHRMVETDSDTAVSEYYENLPIASTESENEVIKAEILAKKVGLMLPPGDSEVEISVSEPFEFVGYIDRLGDDGSIWDLKYSSHPERYHGEQLQVYAHFLEKATGKRATSLHYLVVPRVNIRLKNGETITEFHHRLRTVTEEVRPIVIDVEYDESVANKFVEKARLMLSATEYPKNPTYLCKWCEYKPICDGDAMMLPKNEKRASGEALKKKIWLYGAPFSGKTYLADQFPNALMLNTDGNIGFVTSPYVPIRDEVTTEGRIVKRKLAWDVFKETIEELEKKQNDYDTIVVDLVEDLYEYCRLWTYQKLGIEHESDNSFKAYDYVRTQFLSTLKRLMALDYKNIILISQEDMSRDITKKSGDKATTVRPNLQEKVALKVAGMVDLVGRLVAEDGEHKIYFKASETVFGGGRIPLRATTIPATYEAVQTIYDGQKKKV